MLPQVQVAPEAVAQVQGEMSRLVQQARQIQAVVVVVDRVVPA
jgi:hypothetical protein